MTGQQDYRIKEFESEVRKRDENVEVDWKESSSPESRGVLFGEVGIRFTHPVPTDCGLPSAFLRSG